MPGRVGSVPRAVARPTPREGAGHAPAPRGAAAAGQAGARDGRAGSGAEAETRPPRGGGEGRVREVISVVTMGNTSLLPGFPRGLSP